MARSKDQVLILTSGGIDSTACINFYQDLGFDIECFFIDYGQKSRIKERESVKKITKFYGTPLDILEINFNQEFSLGEQRGRNGFLIMTTIFAKSDFNGLLSLGLHAGVQYYDCSKRFVNKMDSLITEYFNGQIKIDLPFLEWDKKMIFSYCKDNFVPIDLTYSCENGDEPCGNCLSCRDRSALNAL
jgi:7-cyano-7-deazaguanine synthase